MDQLTNQRQSNCSDLKFLRQNKPIKIIPKKKKQYLRAMTIQPSRNFNHYETNFSTVDSQGRSKSHNFILYFVSQQFITNNTNLLNRDMKNK